MKTQFYLLLFLLFSLSALHAVQDEYVSKIPEDLWIVWDFVSDTQTSPADRVRLEKKLDAIPNITSRLLDLLWQAYRSHGQEEGGADVGAILQALHGRMDIPPDQITRIRNEVKIVTIDQANMNVKDYMFQNPSQTIRDMAFGGLGLLSYYPDPENEELALRLIDCKDEILRRISAEVLRKIGTERAIEPLHQYMEPWRKNNVVVAEFDGWERTLAARVKEQKRASHTWWSVVPFSDVSSPFLKVALWLLAVFAALSGLFWLMRKPMK